MRKFCLSIFFLSIFFFFSAPSPVFAQGTCKATKIPIGGWSICTVLPWDNNCKKDYEPVISGDCDKCTCEPVPGALLKPEFCDAGETQLRTALGCIPVKNASDFVAWFLKFAIGIGGGIAFLLMLFGAFQILTSSGDPERLKAGKELIGSALAGLLMIIFSLFLLRLIGIEILQIPGLQ